METASVGWTSVVNVCIYIWQLTTVHKICLFHKCVCAIHIIIYAVIDSFYLFGTLYTVVYVYLVIYAICAEAFSFRCVSTLDVFVFRICVFIVHKNIYSAQQTACWTPAQCSPRVRIYICAMWPDIENIYICAFDAHSHGTTSERVQWQLQPLTEMVCRVSEATPTDVKSTRSLSHCWRWCCRRLPTAAHNMYTYDIYIEHIIPLYTTSSTIVQYTRMHSVCMCLRLK